MGLRYRVLFHVYKTSASNILQLTSFVEGWVPWHRPLHDQCELAADTQTQTRIHGDTEKVCIHDPGVTQPEQDVVGLRGESDAGATLTPGSGQ